MRPCRRCAEPIPYWITIDGKARNLKNRVFCLACSPFGAHNTKPGDPTQPAQRGMRSGQRVPYAAWTEAAKQRNRAWQYQYRQTKREQLLAHAGGRCVRCGYNRCTRALSFHHRDPATKRFDLNARTILAHAWDTVVEEAAQCELLCLNCHMEVEDAQRKSPYLKKADQT